LAEANEIIFQAGDVVFDSTNPSTDAYFIMDGSVEIGKPNGIVKVK